MGDGGRIVGEGSHTAKWLLLFRHKGLSPDPFGWIGILLGLGFTYL